MIGNPIKALSAARRWSRLFRLQNLCRRLAAADRAGIVAKPTTTTKNPGTSPANHHDGGKRREQLRRRQCDAPLLPGALLLLAGIAPFVAAAGGTHIDPLGRTEGARQRRRGSGGKRFR